MIEAISSSVSNNDTKCLEAKAFSVTMVTTGDRKREGTLGRGLEVLKMSYILICMESTWMGI
jgi:hypothetical protein